MKFILRAQLILGVWIVVSPWVLGYSFVTPALWNSVIAGMGMFILSLWGIFGALSGSESPSGGSELSDGKEDTMNL
jgi:hypothetical protein